MMSHMLRPGMLMSGWLALMGTCSTMAQESPRQRNDAPPGRRVDIGGRRLHIHCTGEGGPTVVLEAGAGDLSFDWTFVQPGVARFTRVCSYDRAGYGWSDPGPQPRTARQIALELHTGLQKAGLKSPYVLVGQSFGGFLVRAFARYYPQDVVGMVLVDCLHEDSRVVIGNKAVRIRDMARGRTAPPPRSTMPGSSPSATTKTGVAAPADPPPSRPEQIGPWLEKMHRWAEGLPNYETARQGEMDWSPEDVADMFAKRDRPEYRLGDIPLIVLSRGSLGYENERDVPAAQLDAERKTLQAELARLSTNGKLVIAEKSGHNIQYDNPGLVVDAIHQVVESARNHRRLAPATGR
jgi:pimeloyl-ACP methyl ester carboxylesterase